MRKQILFLITAVFLTFSSQLPAFAQTATPVRDLQGCIPNAGKFRFNGARPESLVLQDVALLTQPLFGNDAKPITLVTIPKNARVVVFDIDNVERRWYRVLWACDDFSYAGWVPKEAISFFDSNVNAKVAPPACVKSITTVEDLDANWISTVSGRVVVVVDVFRDPDETQFNSFFYVTRNGSQLLDKSREINTEGPFLVNGEVVNIVSVSKGTAIGFELTKAGPSPRLFATVYSVPQNCQWDV